MRSVWEGSRYVKIKYFFVIDKVKGNKLKVMYYPTESMIGDFCPEPLQGSLFMNHRNSMLGMSNDNMTLYYREYKEYMARIED